MSEQLGFRDLELEQMAAKAGAAGADLEVRLKIVGRACDRKDLAAIHGISYSYLSEVLNGSSEGKRVQVHMVPALAMLKPDLFISEVVTPLCLLAGYAPPQKQRTLTPEEELDRVLRVIKKCGLEATFRENHIDV